MLRVLSWEPEVERAFFDQNAQDLPRPTYKVPAEPLARSLERFRALRARLTGQNALERYLRETCEAFETAARMLLAVGTREFYFHSAEIYGRPRTPWVARFVGDANVIEAQADGTHAHSPIGELPLAVEHRGDVLVLCRPEQLDLDTGEQCH